MGYPFALDLVRTKVVLLKSPNQKDWDSWGVRDIAPLCDAFGNWVEEAKNIYLYYSGSSFKSSGKIQQSGLALYQGRAPARRVREFPIVAAGGPAWKKQVATTPWVCRLGKKDYKLLFRAAPKVGEQECIGFMQGKTPEKFYMGSPGPVLRADQFQGLCQKPSLMGVLNACKMDQKRFLILFEGYKKGPFRSGQIFAAFTEDWKKFTPANGGAPFFSSTEIRSWPVKEVCNPRLFALRDGWYALGFNGSYAGEYSIGLAFTRDFKRWVEHPDNPLLVPRGWPPQDPFTGRLEGPCFDRRAMLAGKNQIRMFFMAIPYGARNHENAVNALALFRRGRPSRGHLAFKAFPRNPKAIRFSKSNLYLQASREKSGFCQAHRVVRSPVRLLRFEISKWTPLSRQGAVYILVSNTLNSLPRGLGLILRLGPQGLFFYRRHFAEKPQAALPGRIIRWLERGLQKGRLLRQLPHAPLLGWRRLADSCPPLPLAICLDLGPRSGRHRPRFSINGQVLTLPPTFGASPSRVVTFAVFGADANFREIVIG